MKKLLLLSLVLLGAAGCDDTPAAAIKTAVGPDLNASHFAYNGHDYIIFTGDIDNRVGGPVHDPDCKCEEKK